MSGHESHCLNAPHGFTINYAMTQNLMTWWERVCDEDQRAESEMTLTVDAESMPIAYNPEFTEDCIDLLHCPLTGAPPEQSEAPPGPRDAENERLRGFVEDLAEGDCNYGCWDGTTGSCIGLKPGSCRPCSPCHARALLPKEPGQ